MGGETVKKYEDNDNDDRLYEKRKKKAKDFNRKPRSLMEDALTSL